MMNTTCTPLQNQGEIKLAHDISNPERDFVNSSEFMNMTDGRQQSFKDSNSLEPNHTCFPAGTLVHTDKGLVPIQDIKVGDMVLSRPEWGGRDAPTEYKRVVRAFCSGKKKL